MITQAVNSMPEVKDIGADATKEAKIALALEILGIVFAFIPFVDEVTPEFLPIVEGTFDFLTIGGNVGLEVQSIISNPTSAPMDILGALIGAGVRDEEDFASMAATRREISVDDLAKIGTTFEELDSNFQAIIKHDCMM